MLVDYMLLINNMLILLIQKITLELLKEGLKAQPTTDSYGHPIVRSNSQLNPNFYGSPPPLDDGRNDPAYQEYLRSIRP